MNVFCQIIYTLVTYIGILFIFITIQLYSLCNVTQFDILKKYNSLMYKFFNILFSFNIIGQRETKPCVYIINHHSSFDMMLAAAMFGEKTCMMISHKVFINYTSMKLLYNRVPHIVVKQGERSRIINECVQLIKQGYSIIICPEGKKTSKLTKFKTGAVEIAYKAKCLIQPVVWYNSKNYFPIIQNKFPIVVPQNEKLTLEFGESQYIKSSYYRKETYIFYRWFEVKLNNYNKIHTFLHSNMIK